MYTATFPAEPFSVALSSTWTKNGSTVVSHATTGTDTKEIVVSGLPDDAQIIRAVLTVKMKGVAAYGSNYEICTVNGETVNSSGSQDTYATNQVRLEVLGNRTVTLTFVYKGNEYVGTQSGTHTYTYTANFEAIQLTVEYEEGEASGYVDNEVLIPAKGIDLYQPTETNFTKRGIILQPMSCTVTEEAAGEWELELQHPFDAEGRWQSLLEDYIIKAPVPPYKIPATQIPVGKLWKVKTSVTSTPLYSQLPYYKRSDTPIRQWNQHTEYHTGDHVWDYYTPPNGTKTIFMSGGVNFGADNRPGNGTGVWALVGPLTPTNKKTKNSNLLKAMNGEYYKNLLLIY